MVDSHSIKHARLIAPRLSAWRNNHPNFSLPNGSIGSSPAGTITSTIGSQREFQLALRIAW